MYDYTFKNWHELCSAIRDIGAWKFVCLVLDQPDEHSVLKFMAGRDITILRYVLKDGIEPMLAHGSTPEEIYKAIFGIRKELERKIVESDKAVRALNWFGFSLVTLDHSAAESAAQVRAGAVKWEELNCAVRDYHSKNPEYLAGRMVRNLGGMHRIRGSEYRRLFELTVGRIALKELRRDIRWNCELVQDELEHIRDWLVGAVNEEDEWLANVDEFGRPKKLMKLGSMPALYAEAEKQMLRKLTGHSQGTLGAGDTEIFADDGGEYSLVRLKTPAALGLESHYMRHCVGSGGYDDMLERHGYFIISLRDRADRPHMTIEMYDGIVIQARGKANSTPKSEYSVEACRLFEVQTRHGLLGDNKRPLDLGLLRRLSR